jgi:hypothetical protein
VLDKKLQNFENFLRDLQKQVQSVQAAPKAPQNEIADKGHNNRLSPHGKEISTLQQKLKKQKLQKRKKRLIEQAQACNKDGDDAEDCTPPTATKKARITQSKTNPVSPNPSKPAVHRGQSFGHYPKRSPNSTGARGKGHLGIMRSKQGENREVQRDTGGQISVSFSPLKNGQNAPTRNNERERKKHQIPTKRKRDGTTDGNTDP